LAVLHRQDAPGFAALLRVLLVLVVVDGGIAAPELLRLRVVEIDPLVVDLGVVSVIDAVFVLIVLVAGLDLVLVFAEVVVLFLVVLPGAVGLPPRRAGLSASQ